MPSTTRRSGSPAACASIVRIVWTIAAHYCALEPGAWSLIGSPPGSSYEGILFFEDRTAAANTGTSGAHSLGGGGALSIVGTIYLTNTRATMLGSAAHYQELHLNGNSGNATTIQGEIIVDELTLGGGGIIQMNLNSNVAYTVDQVALVN